MIQNVYETLVFPKKESPTDMVPMLAEKWDISYPSTTEYVRVGTNPDPNLAPPEVKEAKGLPNPGGATYRLVQ